MRNNYEWLQSLSKDDMVEFLSNVSDCSFCKRINKTHIPNCDRDCDIHFRDWLDRESDL